MTPMVEPVVPDSRYGLINCSESNDCDKGIAERIPINFKLHDLVGRRIERRLDPDCAWVASLFVSHCDIKNVGQAKIRRQANH